MVNGSPEAPTHIDAGLADGASRLIGSEFDRIEESLQVIRSILASGLLEPDTDGYQFLHERLGGLASSLHDLLDQHDEPYASEAIPDPMGQPEQSSSLVAFPYPWKKLFDYSEPTEAMSQFVLAALPQTDGESLSELTPRGLSLLTFSLIKTYTRLSSRRASSRVEKTCYTALEYLGLHEPPKSESELNYGVHPLTAQSRIQRFTSELSETEVELLVRDIKWLTSPEQEEFLAEYVVAISAPAEEEQPAQHAPDEEPSQGQAESKQRLIRYVLEGGDLSLEIEDSPHIPAVLEELIPSTPRNSEAFERCRELSMVHARTQQYWRIFLDVARDIKRFRHPQAACKLPDNPSQAQLQEQVEKFFPSPGKFAEGLAHCMTCGVAEACLAFALDNKIDRGVLGGLYSRQRADVLAIRRQDGEEAAAAKIDEFRSENAEKVAKRARP